MAKRQTLSKGTSNFSLGKQRTRYGKETARAGAGLLPFVVPASAGGGAGAPWVPA